MCTLLEHPWIHMLNIFILMLQVAISATGMGLYYQGLRYTHRNGKTIMRAILWFHATYATLLLALLAVEMYSFVGEPHLALESARMMSMAYAVSLTGCIFFLYASIKRNPDDEETTGPRGRG